MTKPLFARICLNGVWLPVELELSVISAIAARLADGPTSPRSPYMTLAEAADYLRWPKKRLYKLTAAGAIPHRKHDHRIIFRIDELEAWLDEFRQGPRGRSPHGRDVYSERTTNGPAPRERPGPGTEGGTFDAFPA